MPLHLETGLRLEGLAGVTTHGPAFQTGKPALPSFAPLPDRGLELRKRLHEKLSGKLYLDADVTFEGALRALVFIDPVTRKTFRMQLEVGGIG